MNWKNLNFLICTYSIFAQLYSGFKTVKYMYVIIFINLTKIVFWTHCDPSKKWFFVSTCHRLSSVFFMLTFRDFVFPFQTYFFSQLSWFLGQLWTSMCQTSYFNIIFCSLSRTTRFFQHNYVSLRILQLYLITSIEILYGIAKVGNKIT